MIATPSLARPDARPDDRYAQPAGLAWLNGVQALVRALLNQSARDRAQGLRTGGFVCGYRGSPLGGLDKELWKNESRLAASDLVFRPGVNEELAANAVFGTQQLGLLPGAKFQGVFSLWYAKGPGVDRAGDVLRHGNLAGTAAHGGVLLACGDDHAGVSTTTNHQSDLSLRAAHIPMLLPANVQDVLDLALHGWAASRACGLAIGLKALADVVETSSVADVSAGRISIALPPGAGTFGIRHPDNRWDQERRLHEQRLPLFAEYARLNALNAAMVRGTQDTLGLVASGKAWTEMRQALDDMGLDDESCRALGIRLVKVTAPWPLHAGHWRELLDGLTAVAIVEEKEPVVETQLHTLLYGAHPVVIHGKLHQRGTTPQVDPRPVSGELTASTVARFIGTWLKGNGIAHPGVQRHLDQLAQRTREVLLAHGTLAREAHFCSGCPHGTSTQVPEGSIALAGVGCHYLATGIYPAQTRTFSVMGTEGSNWIGLAPFTSTPHTFVNLGEGTYFHSGVLAIRASVAAGVNVTYKLLYNDAVAMTGGQPVDGPLTVGALVAQLQAEGVKRVAVVADALDASRADLAIPSSVELHDRKQLTAVQKSLREVPGCTALVYVQTCAAEKRRRRKSGRFPDPVERVVINAEVCEGCGDCARQSSCVSIVPLETPLGRKRAIDQSTCNKDYSCADGFCPSFVSVRGKLRKPAGRVPSPAGAPTLTLPKRGWELDGAAVPAVARVTRPFSVLVTGIGGTGVITVGALLGMAAHLEGLAVSVLDMTGMSQKNGGVQSHIRIAERAEDLHASRIPECGADLLIACDMVEACQPAVLSRLAPGRVRLVANTAGVMTGTFTRQPDMEQPGPRQQALLSRHVEAGRAFFADATGIATTELGDSIGANLVMLGAALQWGELPVSVAAVEQAIRLNGVSVEANLAALALGRLAVVNRLEATTDERPAARGAQATARAQSLSALVDDRAARLADYHSQAYAARYRERVERVRHAEVTSGSAGDDLSRAVAASLYRLMAIKDEYEVARHLVGDGFRQQLASMFEPGFEVAYHLAPPALGAAAGPSGRPLKRRMGAWLTPALRLLSATRRIRNTALDPFRWTAERRMELRMLRDYEALLEMLCASLTVGNREAAVRLAALPDEVRGFGPVRTESARAVEAKRDRLLAEFRGEVTPSPQRSPALREREPESAERAAA